MSVPGGCNHFLNSIFIPQSPDQPAHEPQSRPRRQIRHNLNVAATPARHSCNPPPPPLNSPAIPLSLQWDFSTLADQLAQVIQQTENELRLEQAVYGIDAKEELALHELLADGLSAHYEVAREVHYPSSRGHKLTHRQRCDLVLAARGRPLRLDSAPPTLFDPPNQSDPSEALWLEVKAAYQFREGNVRHTGYTGQWTTNVVSDLRKTDDQRTALLNERPAVRVLARRGGKYGDMYGPVVEGTIGAWTKGHKLSAAQRAELHRLDQMVNCFSIPGGVCKQLSPAQRTRMVELRDKQQVWDAVNRFVPKLRSIYRVEVVNPDAVEHEEIIRGTKTSKAQYVDGEGNLERALRSLP